MNNLLRKLSALLAVAVIVGMVFSGAALASNGSDGDSGTIDLKLNDSATGKLDALNALPGDNGMAVYPLENAGKMTGALSVSIPEVKNIAGKSGEFADGRGDLGGEAKMALFLDMDHSGGWSAGDTALATDGTACNNLQYGAFNDYSRVTWDGITRIAPGDKVNLILLWRIPSTCGNKIQGDSAQFDLVFTLHQPF